MSQSKLDLLLAKINEIHSWQASFVPVGSLTPGGSITPGPPPFPIMRGKIRQVDCILVTYSGEQIIRILVTINDRTEWREFSEVDLT